MKSSNSANTLTPDARNVVEFVRFLRENGMRTSPWESITASLSTFLLEQHDAWLIYEGLKTTVCHSEDEWRRFDVLFEMFWTGRKKNHKQSETMPVPSAIKPEGRTKLQLTSDANYAQHRGITMRFGETGQLEFVSLYSLDERGGKKAYDLRGEFERRLILASLRKIAKNMRSAEGRRSARSSKGEIDPRRYLRLLASRDEIASVPLRKRKRTRSRFIVVCDFSGSMDGLWEFPIMLSQLAVNKFAGSHAFCFSTSVLELNHFLQGTHISNAVERIADSFQGWGGGTKIAASLEEIFRHPMSHRLKEYVVLIYSDGFDLDDPEVLRKHIQRVSNSVRGIIWINPLADRNNFDPVATPMGKFMDPTYQMVGTEEFLSSKCCKRKQN
ncbi:MAG: VWA domain-containing protein [Thermoplasmataceae archaeon]